MRNTLQYPVTFAEGLDAMERAYQRWLDGPLRFGDLDGMILMVIKDALVINPDIWNLMIGHNPHFAHASYTEEHCR